MEEQLRHIRESLKAEGLSEQERLVLRRRLEYFMHEHQPLAPFHIRVAEYFTYTAEHVRWRVRASALALMLVLFTGVGTSYAAEGALPGEALYFVKVSINEPMLGALARSHEARAQWHVALAERRLGEAEALAAEGRLGKSESTKIAALLHDTTSAFDANVAGLAISGDPIAVTEAKLELNTSLDAHENVLLALSTRLPDTEENLAPVVRALQERKSPAIAAARESHVMGSEPKVGSEQDENSARERVEKRKKRAAESLETVRTLVQEVREEVSSTTLEIIEHAASTTDSSIHKGYREEDEGKYEHALESFAEAIRTSKQAEIQLKTDIRIRKNGRDAKSDRPEAQERERSDARDERTYPQGRNDDK